MMQSCQTSTVAEPGSVFDRNTLKQALARMREIENRYPTPRVDRFWSLRAGGSLAGMNFHLVDAQDQRRTPRDVKGPWVRPVAPSKRRGRRGTRRAWKRANPPHRVWFYREPTDVLVIEGRTIIATARQYAEIKSRIAPD
jgi:hypothetical protein